MKHIVLTAGAVLLAAVPVSMGLVGNTSFAQSVPVRVPAHAVVADDNGGKRAVDDPEPSDANTPEPSEDNSGNGTQSESGG